MEIRPATVEDCPGIARVQVDGYRKAYAEILPQAFFEHFSYQTQEPVWRDWFSGGEQGPLFVAGTGRGEIVGYALGQHNPGELEPFECELVSLHVHADHQRRGLGRALFGAASLALAIQGARSLFLWVWEGNPARVFYENLGGEWAGRKAWENNAAFGTEIYQVAYGWRDIRTLFPPLQGGVLPSHT